MIENQLETTLRPLGAMFEGATDRLIRMRRVHTGAGFSKSRTSVILMRQADGEPYIAMLVDGDLQYRGPDGAILNLFGSSVCKNNWRVLPLDDAGADPCIAVKLALQLLGNEATDGSIAVPSLLDRYGVSTRVAHPFETFGRDRELLSAISFLTTQSPGLLLVTGDDGVGKSAFVSGLAQRMNGWEFITVNLPAVFAGASSESAKERLLARLLEDAAKRRSLVLVLDRIQLVASLPMASELLGSSLNGPIVGMLPRSYVRWFPANSRHGAVIELEGLDRKNSLAAVDGRRLSFQAHHGIVIAPEMAAAAFDRSIQMNGFLPEKATTLLDLACSRAAAEGALQVQEIHVLLAASEIENWHAMSVVSEREVGR